MSDSSYQVEEPRFLQEFHSASLRISLKECSMSQLCSICHDLRATLHNPGADGQ